jgi:hypothetical protein
VRISLSIVAIIAVVFWSYSAFEREEKERELRKSTHVIEAEILDLRCGKRGNIKFKINGRIFNKPIYLSTKECSELSSQETIGIKMGSEGNILFANDSYNDWSEAESVAAVLLCLSLVSLIIYHGLIPEKFKIRKNKKRK